LTTLKLREQIKGSRLDVEFKLMYFIVLLYFGSGEVQEAKFEQSQRKMKPNLT